MRNCSGGLFLVDEFACESQVYFLTHFHSDHTAGLSEKWRRGPLYCSSVTAQLLMVKFKRFDSSLLRILDVGIPTLVMHRQDPSSTLFEVIAIDANHCPGSLILVFHGNFGCIVHTGDFKWASDGAMKVELCKALRGGAVDALYIDNTFCNPRFNFPPQNVAADKIIELIKNHPEHEFVIGVDNLGKEELLLHIAEQLNTKVWVWPERLRTMHLLGHKSAFTLDTSATRIRAVPRYSFSVHCLNMLNTMCPTIGILPTGCPCLCNPSDHHKSRKPCSDGCYRSWKAAVAAAGSTEQQDLKLVAPFVYLVPYSLHSSFGELKEFIEVVRPEMVMGIVKSPPIYNISPSRQLLGRGFRAARIFGMFRRKTKRQRLRARGTRIRTLEVGLQPSDMMDRREEIAVPEGNEEPIPKVQSSEGSEIPTLEGSEMQSLDVEELQTSTLEFFEVQSSVESFVCATNFAAV